MDITLRDYLAAADSIQNNVIKANMRAEDLSRDMISLRTGIKMIQAVAKKMADVSNMIQQVIDYSNHQYTRIDPYPRSDSHAVVRYLYPEEERPVSYTHANIKLNVKSVRDTPDIPTSALYYIKDLDQFAININGVVIKGNVGNVADYGSERTAWCEYGTCCKAFQNAIQGRSADKSADKSAKESARPKSNFACHYYHPPEDYIRAGAPIEKYHEAHRNFTAGSWITANTLNAKKQSKHFMRHIGSLDTLASDLHTMQKRQYHDEVATREDQLIHDLLIYMILIRNGYVERYRE